MPRKRDRKVWEDEWLLSRLHIIIPNCSNQLPRLERLLRMLDDAEGRFFFRGKVEESLMLRRAGESVVEKMWAVKDQ